MQRQRFTGTERIQRTGDRRKIPVIPHDSGALSCCIQKRGGLAEASSCCEDDAGDNPGRAGGKQDLYNRYPVCSAKRHTARLVTLRKGTHRILGCRCDRRKTQNRNRERAGKQVPSGAGHQNKDQIAEQTDDDRRERGERLNADTDESREFRVARVFRHVNASEHAQRNADEKRPEYQIDGVEKLIADSLGRET